LKSYY